MSDYIAPEDVLTGDELTEYRGRRVPPPRPVENSFEEPSDAAVRLGLGLRPKLFEISETVIDPRPCPSWCLYGATGWQHEIHHQHPFDAYHCLGTGATVALSRHRADRHYGRDEDDRWIETASIHVDAGQVGDQPPHLSLHLRLWPGERKKAPSADLSVADAKELITALTYVVDVLEGRRSVIEGSQ